MPNLTDQQAAIGLFVIALVMLAIGVALTVADHRRDQKRGNQ